MAYIFYSCIQFSVLIGHPPPSQLKGNVCLQSYTPQLLRPGRNFFLLPFLFFSPMSDSSSERDPPPSWMMNGSCHNPLLDSDGEYLINNPVELAEISKAIILFIISLLTIITNLCFILSINLDTVRR